MQNADHLYTGCVYRSENGRKCAIGHLIPDDKYTPKFEQTRVDFDILAAANVACNIDNLVFTGHLQNVHDNSSSSKHMQENLIKFANVNNLTVPEITYENPLR